MDADEFSAEVLAEQNRVALGGADAPAAGAPTLRERFRRAMFFQHVDQIPNFEFGYWARTLEEWHAQGLPKHVVDEASAYNYFGIENWTWAPVNANITPLYEDEETLSEDDERRVYRNRVGCVAEVNKKGDQSIPHFIDYPVKDRASWEPYKACLDPADPRRYEELEEDLARLRSSGVPVGVGGGSLIGTARDLIGFERIAVMPYEDPDLFREIVDAFGACACGVLERLLPRIQADFCMGWEDICFNQGPIISPETYRAVIGPWYRRIADLLVQHGCCVYCTDCDGNVVPLIDVFLDHGMNTVFPAEVHAGTDPVLLRERWGTRIRIWGGVDKMVLRESRAAIDAELARIRPYVEQGGFLPGVDHRVPADVPLANYLHYLDRKRKLFNVGGTPKY